MRGHLSIRRWGAARFVNPIISSLLRDEEGALSCVGVSGEFLPACVLPACALCDVVRIALVVEYECDKVDGGAVADASRFVYEDRNISHQAVPSATKMPRETPRLRDSPPCVESYFSYTTSRSAESIVCEPEHKFVTIEANTCSTYREAA